MKRILILILTVCLCFCFTACKEQAVAENREEVIINSPIDDTVNGYRVNSKKSDTMPDTIKGELVGADGDNKQYTIDNDFKNDNNTAVTGSYCANKNSKIFHKSNCGSVSKMKEENKVYFSDRAELINNGYNPCKSCEP